MDLVWPDVVFHVERVRQHGMGDTIETDEMLESIRSGRRILWVVHEQTHIIACIVLELVRYASHNLALRVVLIAGSRFKEWGQTAQCLASDYAALVGASTLEATVRPGLTRWLGRMGWRERATVMDLPVQVHHDG